MVRVMLWCGGVYYVTRVVDSMLFLGVVLVWVLRWCLRSHSHHMRPVYQVLWCCRCCCGVNVVVVLQCVLPLQCSSFSGSCVYNGKSDDELAIFILRADEGYNSSILWEYFKWCSEYLFSCSPSGVVVLRWCSGKW